MSTPGNAGNQNPQGQAAMQVVPWENASLQPYMRHYYRRDDRPDYDWDEEIRKAARLDQAIAEIERSPEFMEGLVAAFVDPAQPYHPYRDFADEPTVMGILLFVDRRKHGGFYLPPRTPANVATLYAYNAGSSTVRYPGWPPQQEVIPVAPGGFGRGHGPLPLPRPLPVPGPAYPPVSGPYDHPSSPQVHNLPQGPPGYGPNFYPWQSQPGMSPAEVLARGQPGFGRAFPPRGGRGGGPRGNGRGF